MFPFMVGFLQEMSEKAFYTNKEEWNDYLARLAI